MRAITITAIFLSMASSSLAYLVTTPNGDEGRQWGALGPQSLEWNRVNTDSQWFAVILTNQDRTILSRDIILERYVDGTHLRQWIWPPQGSGSFPTGDHFRVNLVKSAEEPNVIYAQSNEFSIRY